MEIQDAVLWISFVTGILGAIAFIWQFWRYWIDRREGRNKRLNENVLRPWSELQVRENFGPSEEIGIRLWIPKESLPTNLAPSLSQDGLLVDRLPGLAKGKSFLKEHDPPTFSLWVKVTTLRDHFAKLRRQKRAVIEDLVRTGMSEMGGGLRAVQWKDFEPGTYVFENIVAQVEDSTYYATKYDRSSISPTVTRTSSNEKYFLEVSGGQYQLIKIPEEQQSITKAFQDRFERWTSSPQIQAETTQMVRIYADLEVTVEAFRSALKETAVSIDMSGG